jgi:transposase-like protein
MNCQACQTPAKRFGKDRKGNQRFRCRTCRKTFSERPERPLGSMTLPLEKALLCLHMLLRGQRRPGNREGC